MASSASLIKTFVYALESVGTAATLTGGGFYLHRCGFVSAEGKKVLARYTQQVSIPALFLSRLIGCAAGAGPATSEEEGACSSIWDQMSDLWILFVWPLYVIGMGLVVGGLACAISSTPNWQRPSLIVAIACNNSFSLPITLLSVFEGSHVVSVDATQYLSMYVILQVVLMWGIGGSLLTPVDSDRFTSSSSSPKTAMPEQSGTEHALLLSTLPDDSSKEACGDVKQPTSTTTTLLYKGAGLISKALQPPVVAAILGLIVAGIPRVRFLLVSPSEDNDALLAWFFRGLVSIGKSAVPVSMAVLGINLSMAALDHRPTSGDSSRVNARTIVAVILSRMILMPILGVCSVFLLSQLTARPSSSTATTDMSSFYLVLMIVFITPTANSVLIMVELADGMREGIATILAWQYFLSPVLLTCSIAVVLHVAASL